MFEEDVTQNDMLKAEHAARLNVFTREYHKSGTACRGRACKLYSILTGLMKE